MKSRAKNTLVAITAAMACSATFATENGGSTWPLGLENYLVAALPPPGLYGMVFGNYYHADRLKDGQGNAVPLGFDVKVAVVAPRLVWVTKETVLGGQLAFHAVAPLIDLKVSVAGNSQSKGGLGDVVFGPVLGYHHSDKLHSVAVLDFTTPTGKYNANDLANLGRNYWSVRPMYGMSYIDPAGLNWDFLAMYNHNLKNRDTNYKSGDELNVDYSVGWGLGNGWTLGAGGYIYQQLNDDKLNGATVTNSKGRSFAIGPSIKYQSNAGWFVTAKWQKDSNVRNRAEGSAFWLKAVVPF